MKVVEITVHAGRTFNHPYESFANSKPGLSLRASLDDGEEVEVATKQLQEKAECLVEELKQRTLADLRYLEEKARIDTSIASIEGQIERLQEDLARLKENPQNEMKKLIPQLRPRKMTDPFREDCDEEDETAPL